jgi:hypothetical protein
VRCRVTKCPLLIAFFSLSEVVTFLPEGVIVGFQNCMWDFQERKKMVEKKIGGPPLPVPHFENLPGHEASETTMCLAL